MAYRTLRNYRPVQISGLWDRWQRGETLKAIGREFEWILQSISIGP